MRGGAKRGREKAQRRGVTGRERRQGDAEEIRRRREELERSISQGKRGKRSGGQGLTDKFRTLLFKSKSFSFAALLICGGHLPTGRPTSLDYIWLKTSLSSLSTSSLGSLGHIYTNFEPHSVVSRV